MLAQNSDATAETCRIAPGESNTRVPVFSVLLKRTYTILPGRPAVRSATQRPLNVMDKYYDDGDPQVTTIQEETDLMPWKIGTDFVVNGRAYAPRGVPAQQMKVSASVGSYSKELLITGDRFCEYQSNRAPIVTDPLSFTHMDIRYERAYGGKDERSVPQLPFTYPRNHIGKGVVVKNTKEAVERLPLPNIEDPSDSLTPDRIVLGEFIHWNRQPFAQGFGWFHRIWYPRCSFLGAMPGWVPLGEVMREAELGLVERDQADRARAFRLPSKDPRFYNGASLGLWMPFLSGNEAVKCVGLTANGILDFCLPGETPAIGLDIGLGEHRLEPVLHSVTVRLEDNEVDLVWRAAREYPGVEWLSKMKRLHCTVQ